MFVRHRSAACLPFHFARTGYTNDSEPKFKLEDVGKQAGRDSQRRKESCPITPAFSNNKAEHHKPIQTDRWLERPVTAHDNKGNNKEEESRGKNNYHLLCGVCNFDHKLQRAILERGVRSIRLILNTTETR